MQDRICQVDETSCNARPVLENTPYMTKITPVPHPKRSKGGQSVIKNSSPKTTMRMKPNLTPIFRSRRDAVIDPKTVFSFLRTSERPPVVVRRPNMSNR
jgi:hypothetical protein